jgi:hypothetical protein
MSHVLLVLLDVDAGHEDALNRSYPQHLSRRLGFSGFITAQHLLLVDGHGPRHLAWYELATPQAATSREYLSHPPDETSRIIAEHGQLRVRAVYTDAAPTPTEPPGREVLLLTAPLGAQLDGRHMTTDVAGAAPLLVAWPDTGARHQLPGPTNVVVVHGLYR